MKKIELFFKKNWLKFVAFIVVLGIAASSMTFFAKMFTDPQTYVETIQSIDEKKATILGVSTAIAGSATLLAAVPDDSTTPLAEKMMDLSSYLVIVICVLVLEKSLLTVFGSVSCYVLFPLACAFVLAFILKKKQAFISWAIKFAVLAVALLAIVPASMRLSDYIYDVNQLTIEQEVDTIIESTEPETPPALAPEEDSPWYTKLWDKITAVVKDSANTVTTIGKNAVEIGKQALNKFTDAVSVFVISYCAIPIFIVFLFLWFLKTLFGISINIDVHSLPPKKTRKQQKEAVVDDNQFPNE